MEIEAKKPLVTIGDLIRSMDSEDASRGFARLMGEVAKNSKIPLDFCLKYPDFDTVLNEGGDNGESLRYLRCISLDNRNLGLVVFLYCTVISEIKLRDQKISDLKSKIDLVEQLVGGNKEELLNYEREAEEIEGNMNLYVGVDIVRLFLSLYNIKQNAGRGSYPLSVEKVISAIKTIEDKYSDEN